MNATYGNTPWEVYVYGCYLAVGILLFIYIFYSIFTRNSALKSMLDEGFIEEQRPREK